MRPKILPLHKHVETSAPEWTCYRGRTVFENYFVASRNDVTPLRNDGTGWEDGGVVMNVFIWSSRKALQLPVVDRKMGRARMLGKNACESAFAEIVGFYQCHVC